MSSDMFPDKAVDYMLSNQKAKAEFCKTCGNEVKVAILKGSGYCSGRCNPDRPKGRETPLVDAGITALIQQPKGEVNLPKIY